MTMTKCTTKRMMATILAIILAVSSLACMSGLSVNAASATNGIVKGADVPNVENSFTTTLSSGETTTIKIVNSILTIKVDASEYTFQIGKITKTTDAAVVNEKDGLLHILTLGGAYYVFDLYSGVQIAAYRNISNGKYCSSRNSFAYMVYGKSLINNSYFYELLTSNSVARELLMTRYEFDIIIGGGDPSIEIVKPTEQLTTEAPTCKPTEAPTCKPTEAPTCKPTEAPTCKPTEAPTCKPTEAPTCKPTEAPTCKPTEAPTCKPTEAPTEATTKKVVTFDFEYWWFEYECKHITLDQFLQVLKGYGWNYNTDITGCIYYFYDESGSFYTIKVIQKVIEEPTVIPTQQPTEVPTVIPTQEPTEAPTVVPTQERTEESTVVPTQEPTQVIVPTIPATEPTEVIIQKFDFEYWWNQYIAGIITWEQFSQAVWQNQWHITTENAEYSTTYYFYDESGKLIRTETVTKSKKTEDGQGQGNANVNASGSAEANVEVEATGEISGSSTTVIVFPDNQKGNLLEPAKSPRLSKDTLTVYVSGKTKKLTLENADGPVTWTRSNKKVKLTPYGTDNQACEVKGLKKGKVTVTAKCNGKTYKVLVTVKKVHSRVITSGKRIKLYTGKNKLHGWLLFNPKTGRLNWNGYKMKKVKTCGFIQKSWNVIVVTKSGKVYKLPKKTAKVKHKTRIKCEKAIALNRDSYGFVKYVKTKCGGLKNVSGK